MNKMNPQEYAEYVKQRAPKTPMWRNICFAFLIGGGICVLGELIGTWIMSAGVTKTDAATWMSVALIFLGALVTVLGFYDKIAKHAGAGTLVPITGFANAIVSSAIEFKSEGFVLGLGAKIFAVAGPVIVFGAISGVAAGVVQIIFKI